ncbi:MAG: hypothetical protein Kow0037_22880 [Calditrichia bacterium]
MKRFFVITLTLLLALNLFASEEYYFTFRLSEAPSLDRLTNLISIDDVRGDTVYAYANPEQLAAFQSEKVPFRLLPHPGSLYEHEMSNRALQLTGWDTYPTYDAYVQMMQDFANNYPAICRLDTFGTSVQGRLLLNLIISDNVQQEEAEPEFYYTSTMHGDETVGYVLLLRLADYLLSNYGQSTPEGQRVTRLINNAEIWINPLFNPDGTYAGGNNTVTGAHRSNANGVDLNRNFPDRVVDPNNTTAGREVETAAMMNLLKEQHFVLSANFHGGAQVVNYPWDNGAPSGSYSASPDDAWFIAVSKVYASPNPDIMNGGFTNGITNGCKWYAINGGRQDWIYYFHGGREVTVELWDTKNPPGSVLPGRWNNNKESLLAYMEQMFKGVRGIVTDAETGLPLDARIDVVGYPDVPVFTDPDFGDYYRLLQPGSYTLIVSAEHYRPDTLFNVVVVDSPMTVADVALSPLPKGFVHGKVLLSDTSYYGGVEVAAQGQSTLSTADGYFELPGLFSGSVSLTFRKDGYVPQTLEVNLPAEDTLFVEATLSRPSGAVLLVDDDNGRRLVPQPGNNKETTRAFTSRQIGAAADLIETALTGAGYQVVRESSANTNPAQWGNYSLLVWSSGANQSPLSTPSLVTGLINYVNNGGKLIIEGGEIGYKHKSNSNFIQTVLNISGWSHDQSGNLKVKVAGHPITQNLQNTIPLSYTNYGDQDAVSPSGNGQLLIENSTYPNTGGAILGGNSLFLAFNIAAIPQSEAEQLIRNAAGYFAPATTIQRDLAVTEIPGLANGQMHMVGEVLDLAVKLKNYGQEAIPPGTAVILRTTNTSAGFDFQTTLSNSLLPGETVTVAMGQWQIPDRYEEWHLLAEVDTTGDDVKGNNRKTLSLISLPSSTVFSEDFEDGGNGWSQISADSSKPWLAWQNSAWPVGGGIHAETVFPGTVGEIQDEWLISPAITQPMQLYFYWDYGNPLVQNNRLLLLVSTGGTQPGAFSDTLLQFNTGDTLPHNGYQAPVSVDLSAYQNQQIHLAFVYQGENGHYWSIDNLMITSSPNSLAENEGLFPADFAVYQNYPNPFNPSTQIAFDVHLNGKVELQIFDVIGRLVDKQVLGNYSPGHYLVNYNGLRLSSGLYFYRLQLQPETGSSLVSRTRKMLLIK